MNAVEREPIPIRVLNPNVSKASYKPKQHSYRKTNLKKKVLAPIVPAPKCPAPKAAPKRTQSNIFSECVEVGAVVYVLTRNDNFSPSHSEYALLQRI